MDASTNELLKYCWAGKMIGKATLTCCRCDSTNPGKQVEYLTVVMEHVIIANYSVSTGPVGVLMENVALDYDIIQYNYKPQKEGQVANKVLSAKHNLQTGIIE